MFREYAVEPAVISSFDRARYFLEAFGPAQGRFLAELPRGWIGEVYKRLQCAPMEKKRIEVKLQHLDKRIFSARQYATFDRRAAWVDNALAEHAREPFAGIVAAEAHNHPVVIDGATLEGSDPRWVVHSGAFVARNAEGVVAALALLLACSRSVGWIDPYFRASSAGRRAVFVAVCHRLDPKAKVTIHVNLGRSADPTFETYRSDLTADLAPRLPRGFEVRVRCWSQRNGGERLHNRFVVTDVGGIQFGDTIAEGSGAGEEDRLSLLDEPSRRRLLASYQDPAKAFDPVGHEFVITGTGRQHP